MYKLFFFFSLLNILFFPKSVSAISASGGSISLSSNQLGDTITLRGLVKGEQCKGRPVMEAILVTSRGGSPNLDLSAATITATKNNVALVGQTKYYNPIAGVSGVALILGGSSEPLPTDTFRVTVQNAKAKGVGKIALSVAVTKANLSSIECGWDSAEYKQNYEIIRAVVASPSPSPASTPTPSNTASPDNQIGSDIQEVEENSKQVAVVRRNFLQNAIQSIADFFKSFANHLFQ